MNWIKRVFGSAVAWLKNYFQSGKAASDAAWALSHMAAALPIIDVLATVGTTLTPTKVDDAVWATVRTKYPRFFDGSITTGDEMKLYLLAIATELFKTKFPEASTSLARATVQLAYLDYSAPKVQ